MLFNRYNKIKLVHVLANCRLPMSHSAVVASKPCLNNQKNWSGQCPFYATFGKWVIIIFVYSCKSIPVIISSPSLGNRSTSKARPRQRETKTRTFTNIRGSHRDHHATFPARPKRPSAKTTLQRACALTGRSASSPTAPSSSG